MKNALKVLGLTLIVSIISLVFIILLGKTYTAHFTIIENDYDFNVINQDGEIEILDKKQIDKDYYVTLKGIKPGKSEILLDFGDISELKTFYVHKSGVITENSFFGYSCGSEIIPISLTIVLIYIIYLLILRYRETSKENLFQYKNVAYLGIIIFLFGFLITNILSIFSYQGIGDTVSEIAHSATSLSHILLPIALVTFIFVTISNIILVIKESKSLRNLLGVFLGIFLCLLTILPDQVYKLLLSSQTIDIFNLNGIWTYVYSYIETVVYFLVVYLECVLIGTIVIAIKSVRRKIKYDKDYLIILGCKINKDESLPSLLRGRVDRAIEFRNEQLKETGKDLVFIPSGGKGNDEVISESLAMKKYLIKNGIKEKNILMEDKSTNTYQNFKYSNKLITKKSPNIAFSTTNYHVFRAGLLATELGIITEGIGSKTKSYFWINAFIREFIGTLYSERKKHIIVFIAILLLIAIMVTITYFSNNL